ncbi:unnamed protein product [Rotaria magnacalcarata]|nr:unnamed protein product [Rotaria magnacalcarata]CAF4300419.1 unnamed protein product [Rotaria magnacalcarata]CAF4346495.1 unnamed protein product [Rotaria magnacalcarata]
MNVKSTSTFNLHAPRHSSLPFSSLLEDISDEDDDEIFVSSISRINATREPPKSRHTCRSLPSRIRRNYRRNAVKRSYRDRHCILRLVYHRFKLYQLKHILRQRNVRYVHLKLDKSSQVLSIGMKRSSLVDLYFDRLPGDLFDKKHYYQHRQHQHRYY